MKYAVLETNQCVGKPKDRLRTHGEWRPVGAIAARYGSTKMRG